MSTVKQLEVVKISEDGRSVIILDQTKLPNHEDYLTLTNEKQMWDAIKLLQVRGAPAIGVFAGYAMAALAQSLRELPYAQFQKEFDAKADYLNTSRPTAVNLSWALARMKKFVADHTDDVHQLCSDLIAEAEKIDEENLAMNRRIAEYFCRLEIIRLFLGETIPKGAVISENILILASF